MKQQLESRLKELRTEFEYGQKTFAKLEAEQARIRDNLLRISGAIQVLEEMIATESDTEGLQGHAGNKMENFVGQKTKMEMKVVE